MALMSKEVIEKDWILLLEIVMPMKVKEFYSNFIDDNAEFGFD
jgi:hypothetical protein